MRRFALSLAAGAALSIGLSQFAAAADMPVKAPVYKAEPAVVAYRWSGLYVGGHAGYAWGDTDWRFVSGTPGVPDRDTPGEDVTHNLRGAIGGVQAGYNHQIGAAVLGIEASWSASSLKGTSNSTFGVALDDVYETKINSIFMIAGRLGYTWDRWMLYAKGGYTNAAIKTSTTDTVGTTGSASESVRHGGFVVGAGLEYLLSPNWVVGAEYNYLDFGKKTHTQVFSGGGGTTVDDVDAKVHAVMVRLSYLFNWGGPVAAKY